MTPRSSTLPDISEHERYMIEALALARKAEAAGEVPVGAVVVLNGWHVASIMSRWAV